MATEKGYERYKLGLGRESIMLPLPSPQTAEALRIREKIDAEKKRYWALGLNYPEPNAVNCSE